MGSNETVQWPLKLHQQKNLKQIHVESHSIADQIPSLIDISKVTRLGIIGGEPFYNDFHVKILNMIPCPENVTLSYPTNGSIWPDDWIFELWSHFKKVIINFSIDDMYERFTYIRWPLKWSRVEENFRRFVSLLPDSNFQVRIHCKSVQYLVCQRTWKLVPTCWWWAWCISRVCLSTGHWRMGNWLYSRKP